MPLQNMNVILLHTNNTHYNRQQIMPYTTHDNQKSTQHEETYGSPA